MKLNLLTNATLDDDATGFLAEKSSSKFAATADDWIKYLLGDENQ
jgi:hypothetical protein